MTFKVHDGVEIDGKSLTNSGGTLSWGGVAVGSGGGVTISSNANNRVLTGDGTNAVGETNLTFDGTNLQIVGSSRGLITEKLRLGATDTSFIERDSTVNIGYRADGVHRFWTYNSSWLERAQITDTGFNLLAGHSYQLGGTTVIDSSKNLINIPSLNVNHSSNLSGTQVYIKKLDANTNLMRWGEGTSGQGTYRFRIDQSFKFIANSGSGDVFELFSNTGNVVTSGTVTASGGNSGNWNTAYGWGNHASGGYLTSVPNHSAALITSGNLANARMSTTYLATRLGQDAQSLTTFNSTTLWSQPSGYQTMVKASTSSGLPSSHGQSYFGYNITSRRDTGTGYSALLTAYDNSNMWFTYNSNESAYPTWRKVWHDGNDGSGSGLDADTLDTYQLNTGRANVANRVVATDSNGYIQAGWINTTSGARTTEAITRVYASDDAYLRYYTLANFGDQIASHINYNSLENKPTLSSLGYTGATNANNYVLPATVVIGSSTTAQPASDLVTFNSYNDGNSTSGDQSSVQFYNGSAGEDAFLTFHISGDYAGYFGLDGTTNDLFWGGWSVGNNKHKIFHAGNSTQFTSALNTKLAGIATSANNYSFPYSISETATANSVVKRQGNGYIFGNYINMTANDVSSGVTKVMVETGNDNYMRHGTAGAVRTFINVADGANNYSFPYAVDSSNTASAIVQRNSSGDFTARYIFATHFNQSSSNSENPTIAAFWTNSSADNYNRKSTPAHVGSQIKAHIPCVRTDTGSTIGNNHTVTQRGQFTTGTSGQNNSTQAGQLNYHYGYQFGGAWTSPYPDLVLGYHTGMRLGGYTGYGGTRFYSDHPSRTTTILFSVGNGDSHVRATNNIYAYTSDIRLKENFRPIENAVDKVKAIGGFIFDWRKDMMDKHEFTPDQEKDDAGLIAQEVQKVMPAAIKRAPFDHDLTKPNQSKSGEDFLTVQYEKMVPLLVEAIKEQQKQIDELKQKLETK